MQPEQMTVVLTGACGGIGRQIARKFAERGASLYLGDRDSAALDALCSELSPILGSGQFIKARGIDLADDRQLDHWVRIIEAGPRPANLLINNAGICRFDLLERLDTRDIEAMMNLNSVVPMKLTQRLLPLLKRQPRARVINIASTFGAIGFPGYSVYSASKYAIRGFSQALARELSDSSVSVGCLLPRATRTAINTDRVVAMNRALKVSMDSPEYVAGAVLEFARGTRGELALGWPEKLLVRINAMFPAMVGLAISKKLPLIKQYAA